MKDILFFISINKLKKVVKFNEEYHIYLVIMDENKNTTIYNIKNPVKYLVIDMNCIEARNNSIFEVESREFTIKLNTLILDKLDKINIK